MTNAESELREVGAVTLTVKEAAYAANVSLKAARQAIGRRQIKVRKFRRKTDRARQGVGPAEAVFLRVQGVLSPAWKKRFYQKLYGKSLGELPRRFEAENVVLDLTPAIEAVAARLEMLRGLQERVETNLEVRGGEPVFRGTRVPVYSIARKLQLGASHEELLEDHPRLSESDIEIARLYAKLYPRQGRPRGEWAELLERRQA